MDGGLDFWDTGDMSIMATQEHTSATDLEWDPTGRYVITSVSFWNQKVWQMQMNLDFRLPLFLLRIIFSLPPSLPPCSWTLAMWCGHFKVDFSTAIQDWTRFVSCYGDHVPPLFSWKRTSKYVHVHVPQSTEYYPYFHARMARWGGGGGGGLEWG